MNKPTAL